MDVLDDPLVDEAAAATRRLVAALSVEATPRQLSAAGDPAATLPHGAEVYLPALAADRFADTAATAASLEGRGLRAVPHLAARRLADRAELARRLAALREAGVDRVLLLAGDVDRPAGPFASSLDILATGLLERFGIGRIGVAGHPEGHPAVAAGEVERALAAKADYARASGVELWVVTQFVFTAAPVLAWAGALAARGFPWPVRVGVAGPASTRKLMTFALQCGIGASARILARRPDAARLLGRWTPDEVVADLAAHLAQAPASPIQGLHLFPFGGLDAALDWRRARLAPPSIPGDRS